MIQANRIQKGMHGKKIIIYGLRILLTLFVLMQLSTLGILQQMKKGFYSFNELYVDELDYQTHSERYVNPDVSYVIWHDSDSLVPKCYTFRNVSVQDDDINISQWSVNASVFGVSLHNFLNGHMWIWYKYEIEGPQDYIGGSIGFYPVEFTINFNKGEWIVSKIKNDY